MREFELKTYEDTLDRDMVAGSSLLKDYEYTEELSFDQENEGIPSSSVIAGTKFAADPNLGLSFVHVRPGENIQTAIDIVNAEGGGTVFLNSGTHTVNYNIVFATAILKIPFLTWGFIAGIFLLLVFYYTKERGRI